MKTLRLLLALVLLLWTHAVAQAAAPASPSPDAPRSVAAAAPINEYQLAPEQCARAEAYARTQHLEYIVELIWSVLALLLVLELGIAARLQALAGRVARRRILQVCLFAPLFLLTLALLDLPTGIWAHAVERRFGLSVQGWGSFARDWLVGQALATVLGTILVFVLYTVMRRSARRWWLWTWAAMLPILLFVIFVEPFVVEPLFFKFTPLADREPELARQLGAIATRGGEEIPPSRMFVMDASEKLRSVNAYVTGLGASKRVVVWDTTLKAMTPREIEFVFGHELGHYVLGHVVIGLVAAASGLLLALFLAARVLDGLVRWRGARWRIARLDELASLPLILLALGIFSTISSPVGSAFSRHLEHQADAFGLHMVEGVVDDPRQAAAHAFQRLGEIDLSEPDPSPLAVFWLYSHPPIRDRIAFVLGREKSTSSVLR